MSMLLRLLPLLVVGCLLLQSLQLTAVSAKYITIEDDTTSYGDYALIFGNLYSAPILPSVKQQANDRLLSHYNLSCPKGHVEEQLPFKFDDSRTQEANIMTLCQDGYIIRYSTERKTPLFTAQRMDGAVLTKASRSKLPTRAETEFFRRDPRLSLAQSATLNTYTGSGYTRGHVTAASDMTEIIAKANTFILSNMAPQYEKHNRAWEKWEKYVQKKAKDLASVIFVITGVTKHGNKNQIKIIRHDKTQVIIPEHWYKLLVWCENGNMEAEYIFSDHVDNNKPPTKWGSTDTSLKKMNGISIEQKTVIEVQEFIENKTKIKFEVSSSSLCVPFLQRVLHALKTLIFGNKELIFIQETETSFCAKMKCKLQKLEKMGKLTLSHYIRREQSALDLKETTFSAACRKVSDFDDYSVSSQDQLDPVLGQAKTSQSLTGYVSKRHTLRLLDLFDIPHKKFLSFINFRLQKIVSNCEAEYLDIYLAPSEKFTLIPGVFSVRETVFSIRISYGKDDRNVIAGVKGQWTIGNIVVHVLARYDINSMKLLVRGAPKIKSTTINLKNELDSLTGTYVPIPLPSVSLTNIAVTGHFDLVKGGLATVVVSGSIGKNRVHAVFQKPLKAGKFSGAFAADTGPIRLSDIIRKTIQVDISRVPFFGSLTIPRLGVTVSSNYITSSLLPNVFCKDGLLQNTAVTIPKGLQAFTVLNFGGTEVPMKIQYYKSSLSFGVIRNGRLPIGTLISIIPGLNMRSLPLPPGVKNIFQLQINYFSLDTTSKQLIVTTQYPGTFHYFNDYITIINPALTVNAVLKQPRKINLAFNGKFKVGKGDYPITISRDPLVDKYVLKASFKKIPISDFINKFSAKVLPHALQKRLRKFIQFSIHDAKLALPLGTTKIQLHLSGTPVIGGYKTVHLSAIIIRKEGNTKLVAGFQLGKVSFANLIYKITSKNLRGIAILNQKLDTSLLISPVSLPKVHLYGSKLKNMKIVKGVSISAALKWPPNCAQDRFCAVAQRVLGKNAQFSLQATIASASSFTLSAGVSDVRLGAGVVLQRAALQVMVGRETSYGIEGSIYLNKVGITLSAGIRVGTRGVVLQGNMQGCWKRAFGVKWLSICNLHLLIAIQPTVTLVGALEIGGEVRIGNPSCLRQPLIAKGYVGVDQLRPNNNFYYVELKNKVTMETLLKAFCIKFRLPRPLADSGFPNGFLSSFSPIGKELPKAGISIPPGFRLKGTINILGLEAHADITISLPKGVRMNLALSPLRIAGGLLRMYASRRHQSRGPFLKVFVTTYPRPKVDIHASGFVSVLGIQAEAMLRITNTRYEYRVAGKFLHLFQASLHITAKYGDIRKAGFRVRGYLKNDIFAIIRKKIQKGLQSSSRAATRAIDNAKRKVNSKKVIFDRAIRKLQSVERRVNKAEGAFNRAMNKLRSWKGKVRRLCRIKKCRSVCIGCPGKWKCVKKIKIWRRRRCILKRPTWRKCCKRIRKPTCTVRNAVCKKVRKAAYTGLRGARYLVGKSRGILHAAKVLLKGAQHVVRISKRSLDIVNAALEGVKRAYQAGTKALSAIAKFGLRGVFDIREVSFDVALSTAATGHFRASIEVSIFRKLKRFSLDINLRDILSFVRAIGERVIKGLKKFLF